MIFLPLGDHLLFKALIGILNKITNIFSIHIVLLKTICTNVVRFVDTFRSFTQETHPLDIYYKLANNGKRGDYIFVNRYLFHGI
jgi:hypothetical protein